MKAIPTDDDAFGPGKIREDGRVLQPAYVYEVKTPAESKQPWDYYKLVATTPADQPFRPMSEGGCPFIKTWRESKLGAGGSPRCSNRHGRACPGQARPLLRQS